MKRTIARQGSLGPTVTTALLTLAVLALTLVLAPRVEAYVYWAGGPIGRANLDGSGANSSFISGAQGLGGPAVGVAVDGEHLYWSAPGGEFVGGPDEIGRANLDGTGVDNRFITGASAPQGVAVDGEHVYWTNTYDHYPAEPSGTIGRANLDGSDVDQSFITGAVRPSDVAVDGEHVYWSDSGMIGRANLDGSGVDHSFIARAVEFRGVAVDAAHIYWGDFSYGRIGRANLDGSGANQGFIIGEEVAARSGRPYGVAVDAKHIYWPNFSFDFEDPRPRTIGRANLDGSGVDQCFITGLAEPTDVAVDALGPQPSDENGAHGCDVSPSNEFSLGRVKKNKKRGTAKLTAKVPGPGSLELAKTKKLKADDEAVEAAGREKLPIKPRGKAKKRLNRKGKATVKAKVTYTPDGGEPNTRKKKIKLKKR